MSIFRVTGNLGTRSVSELLAARHAAISGFPQRAVPDLCELMVVANATGLQPDRLDLHAPLARIGEVPTIFSHREGGGILSGDRRLDVFHCLRKPDEISFAGGVFVVVRCDDATSWDMLAQKGHIVSRTGATAMVFLPRHLLGLEAATSILDAAIHRRSGYGSDYRPRYDLVAVATEDLAGRHRSVHGWASPYDLPASPPSSVLRNPLRPRHLPRSISLPIAVLPRRLRKGRRSACAISRWTRARL